MKCKESWSKEMLSKAMLRLHGVGGLRGKVLLGKIDNMVAGYIHTQCQNIQFKYTIPFFQLAEEKME